MKKTNNGIRRVFKRKVVVFCGVAVLIAAGAFFYFFVRTGGRLVVDYAYFRKLCKYDTGSVYLFLRNEGKRPVVINKVILDDIVLTRPAPSDLNDKKDETEKEGSVPDYRKGKAGKVLWYYAYPNPVPAGKTAEVVLKYVFSPTVPIKIAVEDNRGRRCQSTVQPENNQLRFTCAGFNKELSKAFLYVENTSPTPLQIDGVYINGKDVKKDSFKPWEYLNAGEKKCIEVNLSNTPLVKGEHAAVKVASKYGLAAESIVSTSSFFPVSGYDAIKPDFGLDPQKYRIHLEDPEGKGEKDRSGNTARLAHILDCPSHTHGTWRNASWEIVFGAKNCRTLFPGCPTSIYVCKAFQRRGSFTFSEIVDAVITNPAEPSIYKKDDVSHPMEKETSYIKEANSPHPWHVLVNLGFDKRFPEFKNRLPLPEEDRLILYYSLAAGAKGVFYYFPKWGEAKESEREKLRKGILELNAELGFLKDYLLIAEPMPLAASGKPQVGAYALQAGYEGIVLLLINHDARSTPDNFTCRPKTDISVRVKIPEGVKVESVDEVAGEKTAPFNYKTENGEIMLSVDKINVTRQFLIKTTPL